MKAIFLVSLFMVIACDSTENEANEPGTVISDVVGLNAPKVMRKANGNFVVVALNRPYYDDLICVETTPMGDTLWTRLISEGDASIVLLWFDLSPEDEIRIAYKAFLREGIGAVFLTIDGNGNILSRRQSNQDEYIAWITLEGDNYWVLLTMSDSSAHLSRTFVEGDLLWRNTFEARGVESCIRTGGRYFVVEPGDSSRIFCFDEIGQERWVRSYPPVLYQNGTSLDDSTLLLIGYRRTHNLYNYNAEYATVISKMDYAGNIKAESVIQTHTSGAIRFIDHRPLGGIRILRQFPHGVLAMEFDAELQWVESKIARRRDAFEHDVSRQNDDTFICSGSISTRNGTMSFFFPLDQEFNLLK